MGLFQLWFDDASRRKRAVAYPGFTDYVETVTGSAKSTFNLPVDITDEHQLDVWVDGRMQDEGVSEAFTRDSTNNTVTFSPAIDVGKKVKIRVFNR